MTTKFSGAAASKELKRRLQTAFPKIKFSVRYESYAGGNSINVYWSFGPTEKEVEAIAKQFQAGSFNGMEDIYEYDSKHEVDEKGEMYELGGVKYVFCNRSFTEEFKEKFHQEICRIQNVEYDGYRTVIFENGSHNETVSVYGYRILKNVSFPGNEVSLTAIMNGEWINSEHHYFGDNFLFAYDVKK